MTLAARFLELHRPPSPMLVMPNAWDVGSARILASLGFTALATTSSGFAATLGLPDGAPSPEQVLEHAAALVAAVEVPVSADLENCYAADAAGVADTIAAAAGTGLAGGSIEDFTGRADDPIYDLATAVERVRAAVGAARQAADGFVLTARAENYLHGRRDLADTIARLQAYREAGADVLYAPGLAGADDIRTVVREVGAPVNVLAVPPAPPLAELADLGVARVSVGGALAFAVYGALTQAARDLRAGSRTYHDLAATGRQALAVAGS